MSESSEKLLPNASINQRMAVLFKHLIRRMTGEKNLDTDQIKKIHIRDFVKYCVDEDSSWASAACEEWRNLQETYGLRADDIEIGWKMLQDPYNACALLLPLWPMLILVGLPPIKHVPVFMDVALTFGFDVDDPAKAKALQLRTPTRFDPSKPLTNGFLAAFVQDIFRGHTETIAQNGLDAMYEQHAQPIGDTTPPAQRLVQQHR